MEGVEPGTEEGLGQVLWNLLANQSKQITDMCFCLHIIGADNPSLSVAAVAANVHVLVGQMSCAQFRCI